MTPEESFRESSENRDALRAFLVSQIGIAVTALLRDRAVPRFMAEIKSLPPSERNHLYAQNHAYQAGWHAAVDFLGTLCAPLPERQEQPKMPALKQIVPSSAPILTH